jgi:predicted amidophosphoribosyltransferase
VRRFKFERDHSAGRFLVRAMSESVRDYARGEGRHARVVSVPMHPSKLRVRAFDHAAWLAEGLATTLRLGVVPGCLVRTRPTLPQGDPRVTSRAENIADAFAVRRRSAVAGRQVILVDDVATSFSTARECAAALRGAGARRVVLVTAARSRADSSADLGG